MLYFIIYEDEIRIQEQYKQIIHKFLGNSRVAYRIYAYKSYNRELKEKITTTGVKKIYIIDIEVPGKSGLDLAREIRTIGDSNSPIIIVTSHNEMLSNVINKKLFNLHFISKHDVYEEELWESILIAHKIITKHKSLNYQQDGEIFQIPYDDILYIRKELQEDHVIIVTKTEEIIRKENITQIMEQLKEDPRFLKTHRSCIVNIYNISKVNKVSNIIEFKYNKSTNLLSRNHKKELKDRMLNKV